MNTLVQIRAKADYIVIGILLVALAGVGVGVYQLQKIYLSENLRSRELLENKRSHIEQLARQLFLDSLELAMKEARSEIAEAVDKPYRPIEGLYWQKNGQQVIPLIWNFSQLPSDNAISHYQELHAKVTSESLSEQWHDDIKLLWQFAQALQSEDRQAIEETARKTMSYDANHRFASRHELVYRLVFTELLASYQQSSRELLSKLLRDDVVDRQGFSLPALQKELLRRRNDLSEEEFNFIKEATIKLSRKLQLRVDDFNLAATPKFETEGEGLLSEIAMPSIWQGEWYFFPTDTDVFGTKIDLDSINEKINKILLAQKWLTGGDSIHISYAESPLTPLTNIKFNWVSQSYQNNLAELENFYRLKQYILFASALGLIAAGFLIWILYRRQARWVGIKSEFVATVAHEMRTPLSSIRLMAERLVSVLDNEQKAKDYPQRILSDIDTLSFLSENILSYERLQSGHWVTHLSPMSMGEVMDQLQQELPLFVKKAFTLTCEGDRQSLLQGDPVLIKLLFLNLAKNSCTYNDNNKATLAVQWQLRNDELIVNFIDNGTGIAPDEWQDSFVPFYRGKLQRHTRGSGLGLALCQKIMSLHNGEISIVNSSGEGTHFRLIFHKLSIKSNSNGVNNDE